MKGREGGGKTSCHSQGLAVRQNRIKQKEGKGLVFVGAQGKKVGGNFGRREGEAIKHRF